MIKTHCTRGRWSFGPVLSVYVWCNHVSGLSLWSYICMHMHNTANNLVRCQPDWTAKTRRTQGNTNKHTGLSVFFVFLLHTKLKLFVGSTFSLTVIEKPAGHEGSGKKWLQTFRGCLPSSPVTSPIIVSAASLSDISSKESCWLACSAPHCVHHSLFKLNHSFVRANRCWVHGHQGSEGGDVMETKHDNHFIASSVYICGTHCRSYE